jgi:type IV pilus assembly protein PilY1
MNLIAMPAALADPNYEDGTGASGRLDSNNVTHASYGHNTIYYNPATTYQPWIKADGTRYTGGRAYNAAYRHTALLADPVNLGNSVQTFYVPRAGASITSTSNSDFYRYQIRSVAGALRVVRAEWRNNGNANGDGSSQNRGCGDSGATWRNCVFVTPTGRSEADEMVNFATWYSYHRSRMKVAKAGASEALSQVGDNLRIGLDTINRNTSGIPFDIPVANDNGLFKGGNKASWYERLHAAEGDDSTPLHRALQRAGNYFSQAGSGGPWGPESANQISCRQNFAILTTDGFWNSTTGFSSVGDTDGAAGTAITNSAGKSYAYKVERPYYDNFVETSAKSRGDTLADVAMYYWKRDLRGDLENNVPDSFADPAFWQHMVTFGVPRPTCPP